ncbi:MAG: glycogen debranching protein GlgX [Thermoguttaceae bacterium]|nr:glycogen debranching protein GlgX [Thermoguttaceae bacterium]
MSQKKLSHPVPYSWHEISPSAIPSEIQDVFSRPDPVPCFEYSLPYGAELVEGGVYFRIFSRSAREVRILFYDSPEDLHPSQVIPLYPEINRWGDVWAIFIPGKGAGTLYHIQADGPFAPEAGFRFDRTARLIDPFARALSGPYLFTEEKILVPPKCVVVSDHFDWCGDRHLRCPMADSVIYEMHVKGFTQSESSRCAHPGTYRGVIEKIPYLKSLGVTAVELMPVHEYLERDPFTQSASKPRINYWGYDPVAFFAPHQGYASDLTPGAQVREFKEMVLALHQAGIEVILDVVFNHTAEGNEFGPTLSFKGLENSVYYILEKHDRSRFTNYSGCGNTVNGNHPVVRELIFNCLRYWVHNFHIDGFRFDLASILSRDRHGNLMTDPPTVETIAEDPMLADTKIIAEAWDAAGAYQVGNFSHIRWAEWNGRYRDDVRRYWRGDSFMTNLLATRVAGSSDLFKPGGRAPYHSINFITSHDGFTLNDLVSYAQKHNEENGEGNRDGDNNGFSQNFGVEGPTDDPILKEIRLRQIKNFMATLLFSQGVPMLLMGDECRRTQSGNNNAYCQNNSLSWFDWELARENAELRRFVSALIEFRRSEPALRRQTFLSGSPGSRESEFPDIAWFRLNGKPFDWTDSSSSTLAFMLAAFPEDSPFGSRHILVIFRNESTPAHFHFPEHLRHLHWRLFVNTGNASPNDIFPELDGPFIDTSRGIELLPRSFICCTAGKDESEAFSEAVSAVDGG